MQKLKEITSILFAWTIFLAFIAIVIFFIKGGLAILPTVINILNIVGAIALVLCVTILPILAIIKKTRGIAAVGYVISSYIFGLSTWILGFLVTLSIWGWLGVIIGLFIAGVGVVPLGIIASILHGQWAWVINLVLSVIFVFGTRFLGYWLAEKTEGEPYHIDSNLTE